MFIWDLEEDGEVLSGNSAHIISMYIDSIQSEKVMVL